MKQEGKLSRTLRRILPRGRMGRGDRCLLLWILLCFTTLLTVVVLMLNGALSVLEQWQLHVLQSVPFRLSAQEAQTLFLTPLQSFCICLLLTLYFAAVLLMEERLWRRTQVALLALLAVTLPGFICVLWGGVLPVAAPVCTIFLLWLLTVPLAVPAALWRLLHPAGNAS